MQGATSLASSESGYNRLQFEKSPYLLQHAKNPVDWYPWGEEAFEKARKEDKPIFLSIGYSTCHWCHVMAHESFENDEVATLLNDHFVSIKVDREERPDIDKVYMDAVMAMTGSGGWPMSLFLAPDLKPFYGGTYFPLEDKWGRPGFITLLGQINEGWQTKRDQLQASGNRLIEKMQQRQVAGANQSQEITDDLLVKAFDEYSSSFDGTNGGVWIFS